MENESGLKPLPSRPVRAMVNYIVVTKGLSGGEKLLLHDPRKTLVTEPGA